MRRSYEDVMEIARSVSGWARHDQHVARLPFCPSRGTCHMGFYALLSPTGLAMRSSSPSETARLQFGLRERENRNTKSMKRMNKLVRWVY